MKRADYIFAIGFDGDKAIVDKRSRSKYGRLDTRTLADRGMFRGACRSAVFDNDDEGGRYVLEKYNAISSIRYDEVSDLIQIFGIQPPSEDITGIRRV